eukprot:TRINITY_DN1138_c0_g1_i1.p1 TRINITY_DN1138_c0_g1~~TRINITY_DN1138_c0_g1_i1.p1  ORF type:complete len:475 (+),score=65.03 TRINITY_DN1138_c0_g1_i1:141-1565(+)
MDQMHHFDHGMKLNHDEMKVQTLLEELRLKFINDGTGRFPLASNFRDVKKTLEKSAVYEALKGMPKGAILHTHAIGNPWELFVLGTYDPTCWVNLGSGISQYTFMYSAVPPVPAPGSNWQNVTFLRQQSGNTTNFDEGLFKNLQFYTPDDSVAEDAMWMDFNEKIVRMSSLLAKESVWRAHIQQSLKEMVKDGIIHFEVRGFMNYILDESTQRRKYNDSQCLQIWDDIITDFNSNLPEYYQISVRFIYSTGRTIEIAPMYSRLLDAANLQYNDPLGDYVVGFDIVNEEDRYHTLIYYLSDWLQIKQYLEENGLPPMKYYFHAGETTWDKLNHANLYDAILLNTSRIGHGFALKDYPLIMDEVRKRGIGIEICPISNQMLRLVNDMRDHPAVVYLNHGLPITISNDDPLVFGNSGLTRDFTVAYLSWNISLSGLKQLAHNSIRHSSLPDDVKIDKLNQLETLWFAWINQLLKQFY